MGIGAFFACAKPECWCRVRKPGLSTSLARRQARLAKLVPEAILALICNGHALSRARPGATHRTAGVLTGCCQTTFMLCAPRVVISGLTSSFNSTGLLPTSIATR